MNLIAVVLIVLAVGAATAAVVWPALGVLALVLAIGGLGLAFIGIRV